MKLASVPKATADATPAVSHDFRGVIIVAMRVPRREELIQIDGLFRIPTAAAAEIGRPLHRALSCLAWGRAYHDSVDPFRDIVLFPDDEIDSGGSIQGAFAFQVPMYRGVGLYLHVALGPYLSDSIPSPP